MKETISSDSFRKIGEGFLRKGRRGYGSEGIRQSDVLPVLSNVNPDTESETQRTGNNHRQKCQGIPEQDNTEKEIIP